jgi:hypothetical protein
MFKACRKLIVNALPKEFTIREWLKLDAMETARVVLPPQIQPIQLCDLLDPAFLRMATVADPSIPSTVT